ncbi:MAG: PKD domain-containing protein [Sandaracinus sp.]
MLAALSSPSACARWLALGLVVVAGCGSKNEIDKGGPPIFDDAGPGDTAVPSDLSVDCGMHHDRYTSPHRPITVMSSASSAAGIVSQTWSIESSPAGSSGLLETMDAFATLTPPVQGDYGLRFTAVDGRGESASCTITVHAVVGPPVAICPEEPMVFRTAAHVPVRIEGDAFDDVGVVSATWAITSQPEGSMPVIRVIAGPVVDFVSATPGEYQMTLTAVDADGAMDRCVVQVHVATPPTVECPTMPVTGPTRQPLTVTASAMDDGTIVSTTWTLDNRPADSAATIGPTTGTSTTITPDKRGVYELTFTATDDTGESASCMVTVIGLPSPPTVTCPDHVDTTPLATATVTATVVDDGTIVSQSWRSVSVPPGSRAGIPTPPNQLTTSVPTDLAGEYPVEIAVTDDDGNRATCTTVVRAVATEGLRVEVFWNTDGTDMDTHVMRPGGTTWTGSDDCNFRNCQGGSQLEWGAPGTDDNPHLDIDDTNGFGPENVNVDRPQPGVYRVGVHAWAGGAQVTVRIYCGGSTTEPRQSFGPVMISSSPQDQFWRVADVAIDGTSCTITSLANAAGQPDVRDEPGLHGSGAPR